MKKKLKSAKNHIVRNRAKYAVVATLAVCTAVHTGQVAQMNAFLSDHNLLEEYYNPAE